MGNLRPGWLADDTQWRDQLDAMYPDDTRWVTHHWDLAGGAPPNIDLSWITTIDETPHWAWPAWPITLIFWLFVAGLVVADIVELF